MKYFFILGNNPALSLAEINAVFGLSDASLLAPDFLVLDIKGELPATDSIRRLGGTIKIGRIIGDEDSSEKKLLNRLAGLIIERSQPGEGKFNFGFSDYSAKNFIKSAWGIEIKKRLSTAGVSARFVVSREPKLSSVVVEQNKLLRRGAELCLFKIGESVLIGQTLAVQAFKELEKRDYGRPARDDLSGMLPPKLAQIMINLARLDSFDDALVDPFCGSGTILSEALVMGYNNLFGSDISPKAANDTRANLSWTKGIYGSSASYRILVKSVLQLSKFLKADSVDAIVTEPYLGPQRGLSNLRGIIAELEDLYSGAIKEFSRVLHSGARVVMIWPVYYGERPLNPDTSGFRLVDALSGFRAPAVKLSERQTIIYNRPGQKVFREIVVLEKL